MDNGGLPNLNQMQTSLQLGLTNFIMLEGNWQQTGKGGAILSSPTLLPGKLNLIAATSNNVATNRRAAILTAD